MVTRKALAVPGNNERPSRAPDNERGEAGCSEATGGAQVMSLVMGMKGKVGGTVFKNGKKGSQACDAHSFETVLP